jgi:hypothetical protein
LQACNWNVSTNREARRALVDARFIASQSHAEPTVDKEPMLRAGKKEPMLRAGKVAAAANVYCFPKLGASVVRFAGSFFRLS